MPTGPAGPPNPLACYQLTLLAYHYLYGNSPWTLPVWQVIHVSLARGFGGHCQEGGLDAGWYSMLISLCPVTEKYSDKDDHWYPWILVHSWEKSQCKKYLSYYFQLIADLIKIDVSDNFVNLSEHFQANVWRFKLWEKDTRECAVITVLWQVSA
jgi:hypothetical protein